MPPGPRAFPWAWARYTFRSTSPRPARRRQRPPDAAWTQRSGSPGLLAACALSPCSALLHVVGTYAPPVLRGEVEVGEDVGLGLLEERAGARRHRAHRVDGSPVRRPHDGGVGLAENGLQGLAGHRPAASRGQQGARVELEVHDAALRADARQALGDCAHEPGVVVADDEVHARESALTQRA